MRIGVVSVFLSCLLCACGGSSTVVDATPAVDCAHDAAGDAPIDAPPACSRIGFDSIPWAPLTQTIDYALFDRDGDGNIDVTTATSSGFIELLKGRANGMFSVTSSQYGLSQTTMAYVDVNADQRLDAIYFNPFPTPQISVVFGRPDGSFSVSSIDTPVSGQEYAFMRAQFVDVNGDSILDLIDIRNRNSVAVFRGVGDGSFQDEAVYPVGVAPADLVVRDINNDGHPDVVVVNSGGNNVTTYLGSATGILSQRREFDVGATPLAVDARDYDHDGKVDLLVANFTGNSISLLRGNGDGTLGAHVDFPSNEQPSSLAIADIDGNGFDDVVVSNQGNGTVSILSGMAGGLFDAPRSIPVGAYPLRPEFHDVNHDGATDIVVPSNGLFAVLLNDHAGSFLTRPAQQPLFGYKLIDDMRDFNRDGNPDLLLRAYQDTSTPHGSTAVSLGTSAGTFTQPINFVDANPEGKFEYVDVNGDGIEDIVNQRVLTDHAIYVFLGIGDGRFQRRRRFSAAEGMGAYAVGDFNGDLLVDIAYVRGGTTMTIDVMRGIGDGTFLSVNGTTPSSLAIALGDLHAADVDGDGKPDLVAYDSNSTKTFVFRNSGPFTFEAAQASDLGDFQIKIAADTDGDGKADLIGRRADHLAFARGLGNGSFALPVDINDSEGIYDVRLRNVVGDTKVELVAFAPHSQSVAIFSQDSAGVFLRSDDVGFGGWPNSWAMGDLDHDGKPDLIISVDTDVRLQPAYIVVQQHCLN